MALGKERGQERAEQGKQKARAEQAKTEGKGGREHGSPFQRYRTIEHLGAVSLGWSSMWLGSRLAPKAGKAPCVSRLRDLGRDVATYFGFAAPRSERPAAEAPAANQSWLDLTLRFAPVLVAAPVLRRALGFADDALGFLVTVGLIAVLGPAWWLLLRNARRAKPP